MGLPFVRESLDGLIRAEPIVGLTDSGKRRINEYEGEGPGFDVMASLKDSGPLPLSEIAEQTHMSGNKVRHIVKELIKRGYVERKKSAG